MELKDGLLGDVPTFMVSGSLDQTTCEALRTALHKRLESGYNIIFLDVSGISHMDDAGLAVLVDWVQALRGRGWLGIIAPDTALRDLLASVGLLTHPNVRVFETQHAARIVTQERQST